MYITQVKLHSEYYPTDRYYPFNIPTLRRTAALVLKKPVVFFVGENGSGKSTLLEALTRKCGVHIWDKVKRRAGYDNPYADRLVDFIDVTWANGRVPGSLFRAETFEEMVDFLDDAALCDPGRLAYQGGHLLNTLSHGEGMLTYFQGRYHVKGLYFLDEPEAALSPTSQIKFLKMLQLLAASEQAQFIIATHSPILLAYPDAQIFSFDEEHIQEVTYEETAHYRIYKQFFADRRAYLASNQ